MPQLLIIEQCQAYSGPKNIVLISKSENGLKQSLKIIEDYASKWKMKINTDKTKILIFNKPGKVEKSKSFKLCDESIEVCKNFKYLGFLLDCNGNFGNTMEYLAKNGKTALYSIYKLSTHDYVPIKTIIEVFNATIKPILLYGAGMWGYQAKIDSKIEKVQVSFAKHILGLHRKSTNIAATGELGLYPLKIEMQTDAIKFHDYLSQSQNELLTTALKIQERNVNKNSWFSDIVNVKLNCKFNNNKLKMPSFDADSNERKLIRKHNNNCFKKHIKSYLQHLYDNEWLQKVTTANKLNFYKNFKEKPSLNSYLTSINNRIHITALIKLLTSSHKLRIETGRYQKLEPNERFCEFCPNQEVIDDEIHFIFDCTDNKKIREEYFEKLGLVGNTYQSVTTSEKNKNLQGFIKDI